MSAAEQREADPAPQFAYATDREKQVRKIVDILRGLTLTANEATHIKAIIDFHVRR